MNLNTIALTPHAQGFIKVACEEDTVEGTIRTTDAFLIASREHAELEEGATAPRLAQHPMAAKLGTAAAEGEAPVVREIPIRIFFNKPENALTIRYQAYSATSRVPVCTGDGKNAKRLVRAADLTPTFQDCACPGPELCELVASGQATCRRQVRMPVQIEGQGDPMSVFEVRTSSLNTYRALMAQLKLLHGRFKGLRHIPLKLTLWKASNEASGYQPFSLMQLELDAVSEVEAMKKADASRKELTEAGINDDMDSFMSTELSDGDSFIGASVDFPAVSEFYATADAGRRAGATPITHETLPRATRQQASAAAAGGNVNAAIADMVSRSQTTPAVDTVGAEKQQLGDIPL